MKRIYGFTQQEMEERLARVRAWYNAQEPDVKAFLDMWCDEFIAMLKKHSPSLQFGKDMALEVRYSMIEKGWA